MIIGAYLECSLARGAEACTDDRAIIRSFKTKNINRTRKRRGGHEGRRRDEREKNGREEEKNKNRKKEMKYERAFSVFYANYCGQSLLPSKRQEETSTEEEELGCSGSLLHLENTPELLRERPSPAS